MIKQSLINSLESIVGDEGLLDPDAFAVDGLTPQAAVAPSGYEQVTDLMRYAHAEGLAIIPRGGGTHMSLGNVPSRYDIALNLTRLNEIVEHEPADLTITCQAGITLEALQRHLAQHAQMAPLGPAWSEEATIGGILAANASGPCRHAFGPVRDFTIGLRVVTADGRITKTGGRVVKNVAGYDLCKLYLGSLGTLAIIVEATFKLAPLPKVERTEVVTFRTPAEACAFAARIRRRGLGLRSAQLLNAAAATSARLDADGRCALLVDLAGTPQAVERSLDEIHDLRVDAADLAESAVTRVDAPFFSKIAVLPTNIPELIADIGAIAGDFQVVAWPTVGVVYASWPSLDNIEQAISRLRTSVSRAGGSLVIERCPTELKRHTDVFPAMSPPAFELMRRVKEQFDSKGILSPGRFVGRL